MNKVVSIAIVLATSATLHADSLEDRKFWKGQMDYLNQNLDTASQACGVKFSFDWIEKDKLRAAAEKHQNSPFGICNSVIDEVGSLCRNDADGKASVAAKIKGFTCGYSNPRSLDLKTGIVRYMGNNEEANFSDWAKPWLEKHL
jgi:hypothetical protein